MKIYRKNRAECGSALIYILIAVALLAALTASFMEPSSQQTQSQNSFKTYSELASQVSFIQSAIQECVIGHSGGDSNLTSTEQKNPPYPINPMDPYFDTQAVTPGSAADNSINATRCPGNPGDDPDHLELFSGISGKYMPPPPALFEEWEYYNGDDGVFVFTRTDKSDAFLQTALQKLDEKYSECEADIIDASSGDVSLTTDTTPGSTGVRVCPDGSMCFRVWLLSDTTAVYQTGGDEDLAGCP